jgi:cbb3-type cytochrome c oxidase subunit III
MSVMGYAVRSSGVSLSGTRSGGPGSYLVSQGYAGDMRRSTFLCVGVVAAWLCGCGGSPSHKTAAIRPRHCVATIVGTNVNGTGPIKTVTGGSVPCTPLKVVTLPPGASPQVEYAAGKTLVAEAGCLACHKIGENGNPGPGENLTRVGSVLSRARIERALIDPKQPMPSFQNLGPAALKAVVAYLVQLRR